jgi:hypothetical protein
MLWPKDFERITDDAFSFLSADHGYAALPAERGGIWGSGFLRRFVRGSYEIAVCFGDADSHHLCSPPTLADLSDEMTPEKIIRQYAQLLRQYAIDVVEGDFYACRDVRPTPRSE